ncbi:MAG: hypothetical protein HOQ04_04525 [Pseudarthrobacter sp.]|nr:hypothetical protein [Pseudarthrobacter sp.]
MTTIQRWYTTADERVRGDAQDWGIAPRQAKLLAILPFVLVIAVAATVPFRSLYLWLVDEDHPIEWLQFACLVAAAVFLAFVTVRLYGRGQKGMAALYAVVSVGVVFLAGEEISWGQRIFGWHTPEAMEAMNRQDETNVHNIRGVQELVPLAMLVASLYGACAPLAAARFGKRWKALASKPLLIPPLCLVPAFLLPAAYRLFRLLIWPEPTFVISEYGEVLELSLYFGLAMFSWFNVRRLLEARPTVRAVRHRVPRTP